MSLARITLRPFFNEDDTDEIINGELLLWHEVLSPLSDQAIYRAFIAYQREGPRSQVTGKLTKPSPGDVYQIAMEARKREYQRQPKMIPQPEPKVEEPISDEEKERVAKSLKSFGINKPTFAEHLSESDQGEKSEENVSGADDRREQPDWKSRGASDAAKASKIAMGGS